MSYLSWSGIVVLPSSLVREQEVCRKDWLALLLWSQGREGLLEEIRSNAFAGLSTV